MMVSFHYDNGAVGSLYYSREVPSLFRGLRLSKLFGRRRRMFSASNEGVGQSALLAPPAGRGVGAG
jgi:hypothetical protein